MKKNQKRHALLMSALSLLLCVSMLVGSTFAWFTDEVTTGMNTIAAGNLDVELTHTSASVATEEDVTGKTNLFRDENGEAILWEPGVVTWENLNVYNAGTLALKYQLNVQFLNENNLNGYGLSKALQVALLDTPLDPSASREDVLKAVEGKGQSLVNFAQEGMLLPNGVTIPNAPAGAKVGSESYGIVIWWEPGADDNRWNTNNGQKVSDFDATGVNQLHIDLGIKLVATQLMAEDDSFDNSYDQEADYSLSVATLDALKEALQLGGNIMLTADITLPDGEKLVIPEGKTVNLDLGGNTVSGGFQAGSDTKHVYPFENRGTLTLQNGTVNGRGIANYGNLTIKSGTYNAIDTNGGGCVWVYAGKVTVNGGEFTTADSAGTGAVCINVATGAEVTINGGKFDSNANQTAAFINYGKLTINNAEVTSNHNVLGSSGTAQIDGGNFELVGVPGQTSNMFYVTTGTVTINGGNFVYDKDHILDSGHLLTFAGGKIVVNGGNFEGYVTTQLDNYGYTSGSAVVTGGTFDQNPSKYVASGYQTVENANGTWTVSRYTVANATELKDALTTGKAVVLTEDVVLADTVNLTAAGNIDLNGNQLTVSRLEAKADTVITGGTLVHGESDYPAFSISGGKLTLNDVTIVCEEPCNEMERGSITAAEYSAFQVWSGEVVMNNCHIIAKCEKLRTANSVYAVAMHGGKLTMNGGSLTVESVGSSEASYNYEAAIAAYKAADKVVTLNDVAISLGANAQLIHTMEGHITLNTTAAEGSVTAEDVTVMSGGSYTVNYIK